MIASRFGSLEVLCRAPAGEARGAPLLFVHGAYAGAWCWEEYFLPFFSAQGYACYAVSLSGHGASPGREHLDALSIDDYTDDVAEVIHNLPGVPILVGHSMGGMVAQKYLERAPLPGVVLMASVPPQGLWTSAIGIALKRPNLLNELNRFLGGSQLAVETLREALFAQPIEIALLMRYWRQLQPESHRAIWDMTLFNLPRRQAMHEVPMLVLGAEHDKIIAPALVQMTGNAYGVEAELFPGMGHGMMLESGWRPVAERMLRWLDEQPV